MNNQNKNIFISSHCFHDLLKLLRNSLHPIELQEVSNGLKKNVGQCERFYEEFFDVSSDL